jgi:hypothetical protein
MTQETKTLIDLYIEVAKSALWSGGDVLAIGHKL